MSKLAFALVVLLLPTMTWAQALVNVSAVTGPVEAKSVNAAQFSTLSPSTQMVHVGDQIRTGPGGSVILTLPDTSYLVISENSTITIQEFWAPNMRNLVDVVMGKVRFYIQRIGGKPNPYKVQTPTALIAVRGTTFEVTTYDPSQTIVACLEGRVAVETVGIPDREVILEPGRQTLVRPGAPPVVPVALNEALVKNRVIQVVREDAPDPTMPGKNAPSIDRRIRDNDRMNRTLDPLQSPSSTINSSDTQRAKPTLRYPPQ